MKRVALFLVTSMLVPALAAAQVPPRPPVPAPAPPAPPSQAVPPAPPSAPAPPVLVAPTLLDSYQLNETMRAAREAGRLIDFDGLTRMQSDIARQQAEMARQQNELFRATTIDTARLAEQAARMDMPVIWNGQEQHFSFAQDAESSAYESGKNYLGQRQYEQAIMRFDRAIAAKGSRADGALYWKAFAQYKLGKSDDALTTIAALRRDYDKSRYLADARVLEADVKKTSGQPVNPASMDDDDMLLLAITGIMNSDPPRAVPLIEGVLSRTNSLKVKQRALYVLALSDQPQAHTILLGYAKGNGNPDLQREAINYLATRRSKQTTTSAELLDIYNATNDPAIKMTVLSAFRASGDKNSLVTVAGSTAPLMIRQNAISNLTELASPQEVWALYQKEQDKDLRIQIVSVLSSMGAVDQIVQVVRTEKEPVVRQRAIRSLGNQKAERTGTTLVDIYAADQDKDTKNAVITALSNQNNADGLVAVARKETSLELRTAIVRKLADMAPRSKAAADYLAEIIKK